MAKKKERLDKLLAARGLVPTRSKAQGIILAGEVLVDGKMVDKPGTAVPIESTIELKAQLPYVGRGGFKLAGALEAFNLDVTGTICADVGACTGGFTDVLLQNGAALVYAIDVGYGQLDWSLRLILPAVKQWLMPDAKVVALIKPQFEAGPKQVGRGGIVKDTAVHRLVLQELWDWFRANDLSVHGLTRSPVTGAEGNVEFLVWLQVGGEDMVAETAVDALLADDESEN